MWIELNPYEPIDLDLYRKPKSDILDKAEKLEQQGLEASRSIKEKPILTTILLALGGVAMIELLKP